MKPKIKDILILVLIFILGFSVGMTFAFEAVFKKLKAYGITL